MTVSVEALTRNVKVDLISGHTIAVSHHATLGAGASNLMLLGAGAINGTGNAGNNEISGGSGANRLSGGAGDDVLRGGAGNDSALFAGAAAEYSYALLGDGSIRVTHLSGAEGVDTLFGIESLVFSDGAIAASAVTASGDPVVPGPVEAPLPAADLPEVPAQVIAGNNRANLMRGDGDAEYFLGRNGKDVIRAGGGNDYIDGGKHRDTIWGGAGDDVFVFGSRKAGGDIIKDFKLADDMIGLGAGLGLGPLVAGVNLMIGERPAAAEAVPTLLYDIATGRLTHDSNGSAAGGSVLLAKLAAGTMLTAITSRFSRSAIPHLSHHAGLFVFFRWRRAWAWRGRSTAFSARARLTGCAAMKMPSASMAAPGPMRFTARAGTIAFSADRASTGCWAGAGMTGSSAGRARMRWPAAGPRHLRLCPAGRWPRYHRRFHSLRGPLRLQGEHLRFRR